MTNGFGDQRPGDGVDDGGDAIWFVNAAAAAGGDGRYDAQFNCLGEPGGHQQRHRDNPAANDRIFLYTGSYTGGLTLLASQRLIGQGATARSAPSRA